MIPNIPSSRMSQRIPLGVAMSPTILRAIIAMPRYFPHLPLALIALPSDSVSFLEFILLDSIGSVLCKDGQWSHEVSREIVEKTLGKLYS